MLFRNGTKTDLLDHHAWYGTLVTPSTGNQGMEVNGMASSKINLVKVFCGFLEKRWKSPTGKVLLVEGKEPLEGYLGILIRQGEPVSDYWYSPG